MNDMTRKEIEAQIAVLESQINELRILHKETDNPTYPPNVFESKKNLMNSKLFWIKTKQENIKPFGEIICICKAIRMAMFNSSDASKLVRVSDMNSKQYRAYVDALNNILTILEKLAREDYKNE